MRASTFARFPGRDTHLAWIETKSAGGQVMNRPATVSYPLLALIAGVSRLALLLAVGGSLASAENAHTAQLSLPAPTGPYHVGTTAEELPGPSRGRELMVQVWYPTRVVRGAAAPYFPP